MCSDVDNVDPHLPGENLVDDPILFTESRRAIPFPFASKRLVMKAFDQPEAGWT